MSKMIQRKVTLPKQEIKQNTVLAWKLPTEIK